MSTQNPPSAAQIEQTVETYLNEELDPVLNALEKLSSARTKDSEKIAAAQKAAQNLETRIDEINISEKELRQLSQQQEELNQQLQRLAQTTVGTSEYNQAQSAVASTINSLVTMISSMGPALYSMKSTLSDLATMYRATLEVSKHPVQLSNAAVKSVSAGLLKQLSQSLSSEIRPAVNSTFQRVKDDVDAAADRAAARLAAERVKHHRQLQEMKQLHKEQEQLVARIEERSTRTQSFALWSITAVIVGVMGLTAIGFFGHGLLSALGIDVGLREMWSRAWEASTWYGTAGWLVLTVGAVVSILTALGYVAFKLWSAVGEVVKL